MGESDLGALVSRQLQGRSEAAKLSFPLQAWCSIELNRRSIAGTAVHRHPSLDENLMKTLPRRLTCTLCSTWRELSLLSLNTEQPGQFGSVWWRTMYSTDGKVGEDYGGNTSTTYTNTPDLCRAIMAFRGGLVPLPMVKAFGRAVVLGVLLRHASAAASCSCSSAAPCPPQAVSQLVLASRRGGHSANFIGVWCCGRIDCGCPVRPRGLVVSLVSLVSLPPSGMMKSRTGLVAGSCLVVAGSFWIEGRIYSH